jgi:hypothetical protein
MATNRILTNAKEFVKSLDEAQLKIHRETLIGISSWADLVRDKAVADHMEQNKFKSQTVIRRNKQGDVVAYVITGNGLRRHTLMQKPVAAKLTIRTGRLASIVKAQGTWQTNKKATEIKFTGKGEAGSHVLMWVRPQMGKGYQVRFTFGKGGANTFLEYRLRKAKQRPFLPPSIAANENKFDATVWKRLQPVVDRTI